MAQKQLTDEKIRQMADEIVHICEEKKGADILLFHVEEQSILADYYLVCCGLSMPHLRALSDAIRRQMLDAGFNCRSQEGSIESQWIILDYGVILIHLMTPEMRRRYTLEQLWDKRLIVFEGGEPLPEALPEEENPLPLPNPEDVTEEDVPQPTMDSADDFLFDDEKPENDAPSADALQEQEDPETAAFRARLFGKKG